MKILFIGSLKHGGYFQYLSFKKIYKNIDVIDCQEFFLSSSIFRKIFHHISPKIFEPFLNNFILSRIKKKYDLIYVMTSDCIGKKLILNLKKKARKIIVFLEDNPFSKRDKNRWKLYLDAARYYDLTVVFQRSRMIMGKKHGVKSFLLIPPPYQKNVHCKKKISSKEKNKLSSEVIFIGTWFPDRGVFFKRLIDLGLNIKIYGTRWYKDPNYSLIKSNITLGHIKDPMYSKLIQCSKISICLPSAGNFDGITKRSTEIPAIGTLLCAQRTKEHKILFKENMEAVFFKDADECYKKCINLSKNNSKRRKIANNGYIKITKIIKADYLSTIKTIIKKINLKKI